MEKTDKRFRRRHLILTKRSNISASDAQKSEGLLELVAGITDPVSVRGGSSTVPRSVVVVVDELPLRVS